MKSFGKDYTKYIHRAWHLLSPVVDWPLIILGVVLLAIHFFAHIHSNVMLVAALIMEFVGAIGHFYKFKKNSGE